MLAGYRLLFQLILGVKCGHFDTRYVYANDPSFLFTFKSLTSSLSNLSPFDTICNEIVDSSLAESATLLVNGIPCISNI